MNKYFYGRPDSQGDCKAVLSILAARESLNSERTSSLPLAQFWNNTNRTELNARIERIRDITGIKIPKNKYELCFEYAVPVKSGKGKASMTDLMIIPDPMGNPHNPIVIAIEAKYKEVKEAYETIEHWLVRQEKGESIQNKLKVLHGWWNYIQDIGGTSRSDMLNKDDFKVIPYQLLHRIASACAVAQGITEKLKSDCKPIVIYQMFYDVDSDDMKVKGCVTSRNIRNFVDKNIQAAIDRIKLRTDRLSLAVIMTRVKAPDPDTLPPSKKEYGDLFLRMARLDKKETSPYQIFETEKIFKL